MARDWTSNIKNKLVSLLLTSQLFTENDQIEEQGYEHQSIWSGLVWLGLGLLLTLQTDWMLGYVVTHTKSSSSKIATVSPGSSSLIKNQQESKNLEFGVTSGTNTDFQPKNSTFNGSGFTQSNLPAAPLKSKATSKAILLAARSAKPSFNTRQLDEQLALYKQRLNRNGTPPDVLIIGSSRALRGIDPAALSQSFSNSKLSITLIYSILE